MPLMEHFREFKRRLTIAAGALVVGLVIGWLLYEPLFEWLMEPYRSVEPLLNEKGIDTKFVITGVGGAFQFQLKVALMAGAVISSPVWIWQMWAFVLPAMHRGEKRTALLLTATCLPLFVAGAWVGYLVMPNAVELLIGFVPDSITSQLTAAEYLTFLMRLMIVFGVAAQIPVIVVALNHMRLVTAKQLAHSRPWIVIAIFVFAAVATPTPDPLTMLFLALPMTVLYLVSEVIARVHDRRHPPEVV